MWEDLAQVLLGGVAGGAGKFGTMQDEQRKQQQALELVKAKQNPLQDIMEAIASSAGKQAVKSGRNIDFGSLANDPLYKSDPLLAIINTLFKSGGGMSGTVGTKAGQQTSGPFAPPGSISMPPKKVQYKYDPATGRLVPIP